MLLYIYLLTTTLLWAKRFVTAIAIAIAKATLTTTKERKRLSAFRVRGEHVGCTIVVFSKVLVHFLAIAMDFAIDFDIAIAVVVGADVYCCGCCCC